MLIDRQHIYIAVFFLIIGIGAGIVIGHVLGEGDRLTLALEKSKSPVAIETVKTKTETQIAYVPKETIHYIDKATGKEVIVKEETDVQADVSQPKVAVKINGKDYKFDLLQGENQKFENGKVSLSQTSEIKFDIKVPEQANRIKIGVYGETGQDLKGTGGLEIAYQSKPFDVDLNVNTKKEFKIKGTKWF